jgi:hypothetical protein
MSLMFGDSFFVLQDLPLDDEYNFSKSPSNPHVSHVSNTPSIIPHWNMNDDNYVYSMFVFLNKFLDPNSCMVLFHKYKPSVVRKIKLFLENNNFKIS